MRLPVAVAGVLFAAGSARAEAPLAIEDAVSLALTRNERAQIAELDLVIAHAGVDKARVAFLPVLDLSGSDVIRPNGDPKNVRSGQISLDQALIDPVSWPRYTQAKHALAAQHAQTIDDKRKLAFDAAEAFVEVLLADQVVLAARQKLDTAKANLADTDAHVKAQLVSSNDVTRAQIGLAGAERELASDEGRLHVAYLRLANLINQRIDETRGLARPNDLLALGQQPVPAEKALVDAAIAARPDLVARKQSALAAHDSARQPRLQYLPTLGLGAQLSATSNARAGESAIDGQIALTARWTIFDGFDRSAEIRSRDAAAEIADLNASALVRSIATDVTTAAADLSSAQRALASARDARDAARKSATETSILYRQGLAKAIELLDANEARFIAEVNFATAEFDVASAYLALRRATGLQPLEGK
jgi:outer membrane protein TolC